MTTSPMQLAAGVAFALGALHALEPGHGKTALFAYMLDGRKHPLHSVIMGLASAASHTLSIVAFAGLAHLASHVLTDGHQPGLLTSAFTWLSGLLMIGIGVSLWRKARRPLPRFRDLADSCGCGRKHALIRQPGTVFAMPSQPRAKTRTFSMSALLGISGGLIPCPTALATYAAGIAGGNTTEAFSAILIYAAGIAVSISSLGFVFHFIGDKAAHWSSGRGYVRPLAHLQAVAILSIGLFYTSKGVVRFLNPAASIACQGSACERPED